MIPQWRQLGVSGLWVSSLGFGTAALGDVYGKVSEREVRRLVHKAVDVGLAFFDSSPAYGRGLAEERLGRALAGIRERVVVATKAGRYPGEANKGFDYSPARLRRSLEESLRRLRTDRVDLFQLHDVEYVPEDQVAGEAIPQLAEFKRAGLIRAVGVTGRPPEVLARLAAGGGVDVVLSHGAYNLLDQSLGERLAPLCRARGVGLINAGVLEMGLLAPGTVPAWHPASEGQREVVRQAKAFCAVRGRELWAEALRFAVMEPPVDCTLMGAKSVRELETGLQALATPVDSAFLAELQAILQGPQLLSEEKNR